jgi:hypothetical protein
MLKAEALQIAKKFHKEKPHLTDRRVRIEQDARGGYGTWTEVWITKIGPRGGARKPYRLNTINNGTLCFYVPAGSAITTMIRPGWGNCAESYVALPHCGSHSYDRNGRSAFSREEIEESMLWNGDTTEAELQEQKAIHEAALAEEQELIAYYEAEMKKMDAEEA